MVRLYIGLLGISIIIACSEKESAVDEVSYNPETVITDGEEITFTQYGEAISKKGTIPANALTDKMESTDSIYIKISGEIVATCAKKGCWMNMALAEGENLRVTFKDYGVFVPTTGVEGKTAIIEGYAKKTLTDVKTLKHFAKDAGKSQKEVDDITAPKEEIVFVASGVIIKN